MSKILPISTVDSSAFWVSPFQIPINYGTSADHIWKTKPLKRTTIDGIVVGKIRFSGINLATQTVQVSLQVRDINDSIISDVFASANRPIESNTETIYTVNIAAPNLPVPEGGSIRITLYWSPLSGTAPGNNELKLYYGALAPNITGDSYFEFPQPLFEYQPPPNPFSISAQNLIGSFFVLSSSPTNGARITSTRA